MTDRPALPYDWSDVRERLQGDVTRLLERLRLRNELPDAKGDRARIYPRSPLRADRRPGSFVIWLDKPRVGAWKDYATGEQGDIFGLIGAIERLQAKIDVYWWALDFLGLDRRGAGSSPRTRSAIQQEQDRRAREAAAEAARADAAAEAKSAELFRRWLKLSAFTGTPAERYLVEARGLPMDRLAKPPGALRWADSWEHVDGDGEVHEFRHVMVSAMTRGKRVTGLHFTFLKPDGSGKAARSKTKIMVGSVRGAAIRLTAGPGGLSPSAAAKAGKHGPLAIGEGIETSLSVAIARPDMRCWAAGSLSLMGLLDWPDCASAVVLLQDNDWGAEARRAFQAVHAHWQAQAKGRPLHVAASATGSDFNDWARGAA